MNPSKEFDCGQPKNDRELLEGIPFHDLDFGDKECFLALPRIQGLT